MRDMTRYARSTQHEASLIRHINVVAGPGGPCQPDRQVVIGRIRSWEVRDQQLYEASQDSSLQNPDAPIKDDC